MEQNVVIETYSFDFDDLTFKYYKVFKKTDYENNIDNPIFKSVDNESVINFIYEYTKEIR